MKRDMDLIRLILLDTESGKKGVNPGFEKYEQQTIFEHVRLMKEAGLLDAAIAEGNARGQTGVMAVHINGLTWAGHDFLDAARDENLWKKAKEYVLKPGASFSFGILLEWLKAHAKEKLGLPDNP